MEFGVHQGATLKLIALAVPEKTVYGFDSFEGLPEAWHAHVQGCFKCDPPDMSKYPNVELVKGYFNDSIPEFIRNHPEPVAFMHIDCDLYSSTKTVFSLFKDQIVEGTVIVFDELYNYGGDLWLLHEYKAFTELLHETGYKTECIGKYSAHQAGFKLYR